MNAQKTIAETFIEQRYVYLKDIVSKKECERVTKKIIRSHKQGKSIIDSQCRLSHSFYGEEAAEELLMDLCSKLSSITNIQLFPAFSYTRIYKTGEELLNHRDRPSCEISLTLTLGHDPDSEIWPIYFSYQRDKTNPIKCDIRVGDAVLYRGTEVWHWRNRYEGKWQAQVFLHYVDANGLYHDLAYDNSKKRKNFAKFWNL